MALRKELDHINFLFKQGGLSKLLDHLRENIAFDLKHGTNTSSWLQPQDFLDKPANIDHGVRYRAAATSEIERGLEIAAQIIPQEQVSFYDLGCGKGKGVCLAALKGRFNTVTGLDYYQPFLDQAQDNLNACGIRGVKLLFNDMTEFKAYDRNSVVFLYNPADDFILDQVRKNLEAVTTKAVVIYNKPVQAHVFANWKLAHQKLSPDPDHCTNIYVFEAP